VFAVEPSDQDRKEALETMLASALAELGSEPPAAAETVLGDPTDELLVASRDVQLLVMPAHGYSWQGLPGAPSVSDRVLEGARCPVIVLPREAKVTAGPWRQGTSRADHDPSQMLEDQVRAAIDDDPRIRNPDEIAIAVTDGIVTLRGTLGSFSQRRAAVADAGKIPGVYTVKDELQVRLLNDDRREDADIRGAALQSIMWDADLPDGGVDVEVDDGWVTLTGEVDHQYQSDKAYEDVAGLFGVVGVTNEIRVIGRS
jgi:osmotically-inducible protein OsmY